MTIRSSIKLMQLSSESTDSKTTDTPIVQQFKKLQEMFLLNEPATTFGKSLGLLFALIKESVILGWLALCWGIAGLSLAGPTIKPTYQRLKDWWNRLHKLRQHQSTRDIATEAAQSFVSRSQNIIQNLVAEAKKQGGWQEHQ